jgi:hypothetical protein
MKIAGKQVLLRPTVLADAIRKLSLKALYLPDQKRIYLDGTLPVLKHRWNETHEIGHSIIPWHADMMLGDDEQTLTPLCHAMIEAEANYAAGQLLFMQGRFGDEANASPPSLVHIQKLKKCFGNTLTSTLWRFVERAHANVPMVGLVTVHPHPSRRPEGFDATEPCRYCIESPLFAASFRSVTESHLFSLASTYCGAQRGGFLGEAEVILTDDVGEQHLFHFQTFFNRYDALTLAVWRRKWSFSIPVANH